MAGGTGRDRPRGGSSPASSGEGGAHPSSGGRSTTGRPRALTDAQVEVILAEHARFMEWQALRRTVKSQRQLAREFGVSQGTISLAVRSKGQYKQPSPERRAATLAARRAQRRRFY
jgi:hypothetical protein